MRSKAARRSIDAAARSPAAVAVLVTCEHATNYVPKRYRGLFVAASRALASHRGYDHGALPLARTLARALNAPLIAGRATRLLVDLNRHADARAPLSEYTGALGTEASAHLLARWHAPYRDKVRHWIGAQLGSGTHVVHLSCHSFTPRLGAKLRTADVGLLYDPQRRFEVALVRHWHEALAQRAPALRVRRNYPYRGIDDGLTRFMRRRTPAGRYAGIEIEVNQRITRGPPHRWRRLRALLADTAAGAIEAAVAGAAQNVP